MHQYGAEGLISIAQKLAFFQQIPQKFKEVTKDNITIIVDLVKLYAECKELGLRLSLKSVGSMIKSVQNGPILIEDFKAQCAELGSRIYDEVSDKKFFYVSPEYVQYYETEPLFGSDATDKYPSGAYDISEAGKCLAFGRSSACVFHLVRVMEVGLKSLAKALAIPYLPSWESYLKRINDQISLKHKAKGIRWRKDESFFKEVAGDLITVKIAWRNPTMHIARVYTQEEAENILRAVKAFMIRLATRFKE